MDLRQRTKEGILTAKLNGKRVGMTEGECYETQKSKEAKEIIVKKNKYFEGSLNDRDTITFIKGAMGKFNRNTYYKYKRELLFKAYIETVIPRDEIEKHLAEIKEWSTEEIEATREKGFSYPMLRKLMLIYGYEKN